MASYTKHMILISSTTENRSVSGGLLQRCAAQHHHRQPGTPTRGCHSNVMPICLDRSGTRPSGRLQGSKVAGGLGSVQWGHKEFNCIEERVKKGSEGGDQEKCKVSFSEQWVWGEEG